MTVVIHQESDTPTDWSLVVRGDVLEARKQVPYDGTLRFSSADRPNSPRQNSQFRLDAGDVVDQYLLKADTDLPRALLLARAQQELAADVVQEER
jgi:hypothetical protein